MSDNILKIKNAFKDIAAAIEEKGVIVDECDSPTIYGAKIREIVVDEYLDPDKLYVAAKDVGDADPTVEATSTEDGGLLLTFGLKRGPKGLDGVSGEQGIQGEKGEPGEKGDTISYRTIFVYTGTDIEEVPSRPVGGKWELSTNTIILPTSIDGKSNWFSNADEIDRKYIWMSQATFDQDGIIVENWCDPFRITGNDGNNGVDGQTIEFIYRLLPSQDVYRELSNYLVNNPLFSPNENKFVPPINDDLNLKLPWTDQPRGISETLPIEVVCTRTKDESWGPWSPCVIWSKWGEDGMDGDGVEYIYLVTPKTTSVDILTNYMPNLVELVNNPRYQENGFCINADFDLTEYDWTDEPSDVGLNKPMEWVSIRKKTVVDGESRWGQFSEPKLWATFSKDGKDGIDGKDGASVSFRFKCETKAELLAEWDSYVAGESFFDTFNLSVGDGVYVNEEGLLYVYSGGFYAEEDPTFDTYWASVLIKGEAGDSAYLYFAYADEDPIKVSGTPIRYGDNVLPGPYIGFWSTNVFLTEDSEERADPTNYVWQRWQGQDGQPGKDGEQGPTGEPGKDGIDGNGIVSITKLFAVNNDPVNHPTDGWTTVNQVSTSPDNRYMWCQETTEYTKTESTVIYYIVTVEGEPGATGTGNDAPIIYPAGVWSADKEYVAESSKVPYVFYAVDGKYYILNYKHLIIGEGEGSIWTGASYGPGTTYEEEPIWIEMESFEAIYSDIGLFNQALVGKWVFHGDYMFSQEGVLGYYTIDSGYKYELYIPTGIGSGTKSGEKCSYEAALNSTLQQYSGTEYNSIIRNLNLWEKIENGIWVPNVLFNAVTGEGWFAGKKIQFNVDGSGSLGNGISWNNNGDITIEGSIFNPVVNATTDNCINKTVCVSGDMKNPTFIGIESYVAKSSDISTKRIGSIAVTSINLESPTYITFVGASLQVSKIHTDRNDAVVSQNNTYNSFIITPGATVTFDIFDDYTNGKRYLRPQIQMGWFNRLGEVLPCTFNNIDYLDISVVTYTENNIGTTMDAGIFYELISLPENLVKYMSVKFTSLNSTYNDQIYFQKEAEGVGPTLGVAISDAISNTMFIKNSKISFREGGSFGIGAYGVSPTISSDAYVDICLYDSNTMIGWFGFSI